MTGQDRRVMDNGLPFPEEPVRTRVDDAVDDYVEDHPAYVLVGAHRVTSSGTPLFGSDFLHHSYVEISVKPARLHRGLSSDRVHGTGREIVEVKLSEAQWATFVSTLNVGDGVPATLAFRETVGRVPGIVPTTDRREQLQGEVTDTVRDALAHLDGLAADIDAGKGRAALRERVRRARQEIEANLPFVAEQFDRHAVRTVERAKSEVDAYLTGAIQRAGLTALAGGAQILALPEPEPREETP